MGKSLNIWSGHFGWHKGSRLEMPDLLPENVPKPENHGQRKASLTRLDLPAGFVVLMID
jgi:hypothetical protein